MTLNRWQPLKGKIQEFRESLSPGFPELFIKNAYDATWSSEEWNQHKLKGFSSKLRGVYLAFSEEGQLQYVGVASNNFSKRIWTHNDWLKYRYIDIIVFEDRYFHLALALEYFLICKCKPKQNTNFKHHVF